MKPTSLSPLSLALLLSVLATVSAIAQLALHDSAYEESVLHSPDVLAAWHFDGNGADASGKGRDLAIRGVDTLFVDEGKFGGALSMTDGEGKGDSRQGVSLGGGKTINPEGPFTIEMWISPSEKLAGKKYAFLIDNKNLYYARDTPNANQGYLLCLMPSGGTRYSLFASLGFGSDSAFLRSMPIDLEPGQWYHVAFTYDGKGLCTFYLNAKRVGQTQLENRGSIAPSSQALVIGDRVGSLGHRFPGKIDEVRILNRAERFVSGEVIASTEASRTSFYRMEKEGRVRIDILNDTAGPLEESSATLRITGDDEQTITIPALASGESTTISHTLDTSLRPGVYELVIQPASGAAPFSQSRFSCAILPRPLPHQMPIVLWGTGSLHATTSYQDITDIGYTDELIALSDYRHVWSDREGFSLQRETVNLTRAKVDAMMAANLGALGKLSMERLFSGISEEYNRVRRDGSTPNHLATNLLSLNMARPEVAPFAHDVGASLARTFSDLPNWHGVLQESEGRDQAYPSFTDFDKKLYRDFSGEEIPAEVNRPRGVNYKELTDFPADRVVPDEHPILRYYRWYWQQGDGWNEVNTQAHTGLKSTGREDIFTWVDPAVRVPALWGSGGGVDMLNQWTYTYPNPLVNELATNELFAVADGRPGQKVMNMIQIIWKRWEVTNAKRGEKDKIESPTKAADQKDWEKVTPEAPYITIAPDHISIATWLELTHPVSAIANHGWGSLGDELGFRQGGYYTTNVDSRKRMTEVFHTVVKPLAPTLLQIPDRPADTAFLQSFTSQIFAGVGTYGWGRGWGADSYIITRYAGLQPKIVYEEHLLRGDLDRYKVLFMTNCPVLSQSVVDVAKTFQKRGGIIVGDDSLAPAIQADYTLTMRERIEPMKMEAQAKQDAAALAEFLAPTFVPAVQSTQADVITALRTKGSADYIFAINNRRTYGDYLGQYKKVMEKGVSVESEIRMTRRSEGFVYDLMHHKQVKTSQADGHLTFSLSLEAGGGNLYLVTEKAAGKLVLTAPTTAKRGEHILVEVALLDHSGKPLDAVVPMTLNLRDAKGTRAEWSGYYGAAKGKLSITADIASNDELGIWEVEVTEGLTGQTQSAKISVKE